MTETKHIYDLSLHLTYRIARLQAKLGHQASELLKSHSDLSLSEWRTLTVLVNPDVDTQKDVFLAMGIDKGQVSRAINSLEQKGLLTTDKSATDKRLRKISLTDKGVQAIDKLVPIMLKRQAYLQGEFTQEELAHFFDFLNRLEDKSGHLNFEC